MAETAQKSRHLGPKKTRLNALSAVNAVLGDHVKSIDWRSRGAKPKGRVSPVNWPKRGRRYMRSSGAKARLA
jgi:mRNA-degrading endonuclease toxin of MazEF toxin-antitoxin module